MGLKSGGGNGSERQERAKRTLEACATHAGECVDRASTLLSDGTALASTMLKGDASPETCISDVAALYINALTTFCCCFGHGGDGTTQRLVPDPDPSETAEPIEMAFDIRSETAGPLELPTVSPLTWLDTTDLVGPSGTIASQRVLVRSLGTRIMISLCDLRDVEPGVYAGKLTFTELGGGVIARRLVVECFDELWWAAALT